MGKQWSGGDDRHDRFIFYTPTSGIWQSVWLEPVPEKVIERLEIVPDLDERKLRLRVVTGDGRGTSHPCEVTVLEEGREVTTQRAVSNVDLEIPLGENVRTWSPKDPFLYDLRVSLKGLASGDEVTSYFGMRKIEMRKVGDFQRIFLNNELLPFQAGPLDQVRLSTFYFVCKRESPKTDVSTYYSIFHEGILA